MESFNEGVIVKIAIFLSACALLAMPSTALAETGANLVEQGFVARHDLKPGDVVTSEGGLAVEVPQSSKTGVLGFLSGEKPTASISAVLADDGTVYVSTELVEAIPVKRLRASKQTRGAQTNSNECTDPSGWSHTSPSTIRRTTNGFWVNTNDRRATLRRSS